MNDYLLELVDEADQNKDGKIDFREWQIMVNAIKKKVCTMAQVTRISFVLHINIFSGSDGLYPFGRYSRAFRAIR